MSDNSPLKDARTLPLLHVNAIQRATAKIGGSVPGMGVAAVWSAYEVYSALSALADAAGEIGAQHRDVPGPVPESALEQLRMLEGVADILADAAPYIVAAHTAKGR